MQGSLKECSFSIFSLLYLEALASKRECMLVKNSEGPLCCVTPGTYFKPRPAPVLPFVFLAAAPRNLTHFSLYLMLRNSLWSRAQSFQFLFFFFFCAGIQAQKLFLFLGQIVMTVGWYQFPKPLPGPGMNPTELFLILYLKQLNDFLT